MSKPKDTLIEKVKSALEEIPETRGDDFLLIERIVAFSVNTDIGFAEAMRNHKKLGLPSFAGIVRARRRLQVEFPHLLPSKEVQELRAEEEEDYRKYYSEGYERGQEEG